MTLPNQITPSALVNKYPAFLIDAYGVLVDRSGVRPGAADFLNTLDTQNKAWIVVTNDASRHPQTAARWYRSLGLPVDDKKVLTSGSLISTVFAQNRLLGARTLVFGAQDAQRMAKEAGAVLVEAENTPNPLEVDVIVVCDEEGYPFVETVDLALSALIQGADTKKIPKCFLANPDQIYPKGKGSYGMAAGSIANVLVTGLQTRHPSMPDPFIRLGKPFAPIFERAFEILGTKEAVMLGDTPSTDVKGALAVGIDAVLVDPNPARWEGLLAPENTPTWFLRGLQD